jgi:hypothetical protein
MPALWINQEKRKSTRRYVLQNAWQHRQKIRPIGLNLYIWILSGRFGESFVGDGIAFDEIS